MSREALPADARGRGALEHGFWNPWAPAPAYDVRDGCLRYSGTPDQSSRYEPARFPDIVADLAKVHEGDERSVLEFARRWGHLGYGALGTLESKARQHQRESPEPLSWIGAHSGGVRLCLTLLGYLERSDTEGLNAFLRSLQGPTAYGIQDQIDALSAGAEVVRVSDRDRWPWVAYGCRREVYTLDYSGGQSRGPVWLAQHIVSTVVSGNLEGLSMALRLVPDPKSRRPEAFFLGYEFTPLVTMIYWHLGRLAMQRGSLGRCDYCGRPFVRTRPEQRYCPVPKGVKARESFCGRNARERAYRANSKRPS